MDFRDRLREEITFSGLSYKELSAKSGIPKRTIISYVSEQSCMPSADIAVRLAKVLNTSVEYLIMGEKSTQLNIQSSEEFKKLIHIYSILPTEQKKLLIAIAENITKYLK